MSMSSSDRENAQSAFTAASKADDKELASRLKAQYIAKYASDEDAMRELRDTIYYKTNWSFDSL